MITQEKLKELLYYDPETGIWTWLISKPGVKKGSIAGCLDIFWGYFVIRVNKKQYLAHRLVWLYMTGEFPKLNIDHKNGNKSDNSWSNLREATNQQNEANKPIGAKNTSGHKGAFWHKRHKKWLSQIKVGGKNIHLGTFKTKEEAALAYNEAAIKYFGEFAWLNKVKM